MIFGFRRSRIATLFASGLALVSVVVGVGVITSTKSVSAQTTITCTLTIDNPHQSTHAPGKVNVVSKLTCTAPMSSVSMTVTLYRNNAPVGQNSCSNAGNPALRCNAAAPCVKGSYVGTSTGTAVAPPGFKPPSQTKTVISNTVPITCG